MTTTISFDRTVAVTPNDEKDYGYLSGICATFPTFIAQVLRQLYDAGGLKVSVAQVVGAETLVHVIIVVKNAADAVEYGVSIGLPEIIHGYFHGESLCDLVAFPPLTKARDPSQPIPDFSWIVVGEIAIDGVVHRIISTARASPLTSYWTDEPRKFDPKIPLVQQAVDLFTEETVAPGIWKLVSPTMTFEVRETAAIVRKN